MNFKTIILLLFVGFGSNAQDNDLFVSGKDWKGDWKYEIETSATEARVFYYHSNFQIESERSPVLNKELSLRISPLTKLILIYLKEEHNEKHIWVSIENEGQASNTIKHLFLGNAYSGQYAEITGIDVDYEKALNFFNTYKSESPEIDNKLYTERYWNVKRTVDSSSVLSELKARAAVVNNPDEYEILIRNLISMGDSTVSDNLKSQFVKNFPNHPEAIEMTTWSLRKQSYLTKYNAERYQFYKEYLQKVAQYKGAKANERIEAHKAQFLIRLYDYYAEKGHSWHTEVSTFTPSNQVYVYAITASNILNKSPLEAMSLIDHALSVKDEKLFKDLGDKSVYFPEEQKKIAQKCKELPYYLKGKIYLQSKMYNLSAESLEKAVDINEYVFSDYYEAYLDALIGLKDKERFLLAFEKIKNSEKLNEKYLKAKEDFLKEEVIAEAMESSPRIEKLPMTIFDTKEGAKLSTERFKNKTIVLHFWSNSCENCLQSFPGMYYLQKVYAKPDVEFYLINIEPWQFDDSAFRSAISSLNEKGYSEFKQLFDFSAEARKAFKVNKVSSKIIIDPLGNIRYFQDEYKGKNEIEEIESVLKAILIEQGKPSK